MRCVWYTELCVCAYMCVYVCEVCGVCGRFMYELCMCVYVCEVCELYVGTCMSCVCACVGACVYVRCVDATLVCVYVGAKHLNSHLKARTEL